MIRPSPRRHYVSSSYFKKKKKEFFQNCFFFFFLNLFYTTFRPPTNPPAFAYLATRSKRVVFFILFRPLISSFRNARESVKNGIPSEPVHRVSVKNFRFLFTTSCYNDNAFFVFIKHRLMESNTFGDRRPPSSCGRDVSFVYFFILFNRWFCSLKWLFKVRLSSNNFDIDRLECFKYFLTEKKTAIFYHSNEFTKSNTKIYLKCTYINLTFTGLTCITRFFFYFK